MSLTVSRDLMLCWTNVGTKGGVMDIVKHHQQGVSKQCARASFGRPFPVMDALINMEGVQGGVQ